MYRLEDTNSGGVMDKNKQKRKYYPLILYQKKKKKKTKDHIARTAPETAKYFINLSPLQTQFITTSFCQLKYILRIYSVQSFF